ncbi:MAG TPA: IS4 family transposase [Rhabdochlamydiaceae bacterium]
MSVTQVMKQYQSILEEEVREIAYRTGAVKRKGKLDAATLAQMTIFGFWQDPEIRFSGLAQIGGRREVHVTESAISQRFTPACATMFLEIMQRLAEVRLESEKVDIPLLKQFSAVIVEDSTSITLPTELADIWLGCGGGEGASESGVKAFVQWDVTCGELFGPRLSNARMNDHKTPFEIEELPEGSLYIADLGFFAIERFCRIAKDKIGKRYFVSRLQSKTNLYHRRGHCIELAGILPKQIGQVREIGAVLGQKNGVPVRVIMLRVPEEVAEERQERLRRKAQKNGDIPSEEILELAHWTIVITNSPRKRANYSEILVLLRLRWQIERLFRLWKEHAKIDEWRTKNPYRILCEFYAKMCAMIIQQSFIQEGCWLDPLRSLVKAADCLRRECNRIMVAFYEGNLEKTVQSILRTLRSGCRIERRAAYPSTAQLLLDGLDWQLELLLT